MDQLKTCISQHISIDTASLNEITNAFQIRELRKGDYVLKSGTRCTEMAFIASGFLRMYDVAEGKEITLWIGSSGKFITSVSSFVFETENYWNIQALTDCTLYVISRKRHFELCARQSKWLEFDNLLLARSFALLENRMFAHLHTTAKQRFEALLSEEPALFNHVPLHYIASVLGIAPESLSRLRNEFTKNIS